LLEEQGREPQAESREPEGHRREMRRTAFARLALTMALCAWSVPSLAQQPPVAGVVVVTDDASSLEVEQPVAPQAPPAAPAKPAEQLVTLRGRVVAADTAGGLRGARVTVVTGGRTLEPAFTDGNGAFEVRVSPTTVNELSVAKAGFVPTTVGRRVSVRPVRPEPLIEIPLARGAVIAGSVTDELGNPAPNVTPHRGVVSGRAIERVGAERTDRGDRRPRRVPDQRTCPRQLSRPRARWNAGHLPGAGYCRRA
jgi:hypothetical protein